VIPTLEFLSLFLFFVAAQSCGAAFAVSDWSYGNILHEKKKSLFFLAHAFSHVFAKRRVPFASAEKWSSE
jgi:hypothetical protein